MATFKIENTQYDYFHIYWFKEWNLCWIKEHSPANTELRIDIGPLRIIFTNLPF
jgi:hypothetical protein